jgi:hypothetical protein
MRSEDGEEAGPDARHAVEPVEPSKGTVGLAVGDDGFGECETDARKPSQVLCGGAVGIDALVRAERARQGENAVTMSDGGLWREGLKELDFTGSLARAGGKPPYSLPYQTHR